MKTTVIAALLLSSRLFAIDSGDALVFKGKWEAPSYSEATKKWTGPGSKLPLDGVKITIRDKSVPPKAEITGFVLNGKFDFTAPSGNFDVILEPTFPGVAANGSIKTAGGDGAFSVKRGIINAAGDATAKGPIYTYNLGMKLDHTGTNSAAVDASANMRVATEGDVWAAFHGMADMVKEARSQLDVKKKAFATIFPADFSYYDGTDVFILRPDRYDYDVVAHEFGHAIGSEQSAEHKDANPGGGHDGSNQYDRQNPPANNTMGNKGKAIGLAFSEGFGTWFGAALLERSSLKGKFPNVGDGKYTDTEDGSGVGTSLDSSTTSSAAYGDDTEEAIYHMFWDIHDARNEANSRTNAKVAGLSDRSALGVKGLWVTLKGNNSKNISQWYKKAFLPSGTAAGFLPAAGGAVSDSGLLKKAMDAGSSVAEFGMGAVLFNPTKGDKIELTRVAGDPLPKFEWDQLSTGATNDLKLNKFTLALYTSDLKTMLFKKDAIASKHYTMTEADITALKAQVDALPNDIATAMVTVFAESDTKAPATGPYLSNAVEVLLQDYDRAVVAVVDSSGSNTSTDPSNQRVVAAKESLRRLISMAEATTSGKKPDIAAAIDFDSSVKILSNFADPDSVIPSLNAINSSGGTAIDRGINAGINLLDNVNASPNGFFGIFQDRAALIVFTDGENGSGPAPVIAAIVSATSKGYRVHYGFLTPFGSPSQSSLASYAVSGPGDPLVQLDLLPQFATAADEATALAPPATIEEAVIRSGGVFARIGDAASQVAFIEQIFSRGLTNADDSSDSGSLLVGQANTADELTPENDIKTFDFVGQLNEQSRILVESNEFRPNVTVFDQDGAILATDNDEDGDGSVEIDLKLPYAGSYSVQIYSEDGNLGLFNVFIDVQNQVSTLPVISSFEDLSFNDQTGLYEQRITLSNDGSTVIRGFQIDISDLPDGAVVWNATGEVVSGVFPVYFAGDLNGGESLDFTIEYYSPNSREMFTPTLAIIEGTAPDPPEPEGTVFAISRSFFDHDGGFVIEFESTPGKNYFVQFSEDGLTYETIRPGFIANATRIQWKDSGPPKTPCHPKDCGSRFYRVIESE